MAQYLISVVIPTYQRCALVERALAALASQTLPTDQYEVIVSVDGSDDGTREMLARFLAPYRLQTVWQPNAGRAAACNAGMRMAQGQILVLLDDDMEPTPEFLAAHLRAHAGSGRLGVVGAVPIAVDPSSPAVLRYVGAKFNQHLEKLALPGYKLNLRDFYSGNFSIRRDVLLEIGCFDEAFKIYGNEDLELSLRLVRAGVQIIYDTDAAAHQNYTKDFAALARDNLAKGQTAVLLARKHPQAFHQLKLSAYGEGSRKWRLLRAGLLSISQVWNGAPGWVIWTITQLERRRLGSMEHYYALALDYFYWLGVARARRLHEPTQPQVPANILEK
ncbi:MAG TPA: glycosyltransferase family 2 protein [Roseiflexaceae bacterium]|nr:glycosyltransferase family 2 protein [Roseiflexaceae bacterium]